MHKPKYKKIIDHNGYKVAAITEGNCLIISKTWAKVSGLKIKTVNNFGDYKGD